MNQTTMWQEIHQQPQALQACAQFNAQILSELAEKIKVANPSAVMIAARGTSNHVAQFAKYLFETYCQIPVCIAAPSVFTAYGSKVNMKNMLVIGISQSGAAADALEVLRTANEQGAMTIGITNTPDSPIAKESTYHLFCNAEKENSVAATKTFITQLWLMTKLIALVATNEELAKKAQQIPEAVEYALSIGGQVTDVVQRYRFMSECFVLSRGLSYAVSMEAALKIQETCYVRARCYAVSDFHHGPFAMVDDTVPVILFAVDAQTNKDAEEMLDKLNANNVYTLLITNDAILAKKANVSIVLPETYNNVAACYATAVLAQMFACELSVLKGNNPDAPRGLKKVTITR